DYMEGKMATTKIEVKSKGEKSFDLTVYKREGSFDGRQKTAESLPSDPDIPAMGDVTSFDVAVFGEAKSVTLGGKAVDFKVCDGKTTFNVCRDAHRESDLTFAVELA
ncbi:MAG: hypothetical protein PUC29_05435, partial [Clostridia bacterium]|nr:hypothetical protein [Clostridia bacterium]